MDFSCRDFERALERHDSMPAACAHAETCETCRRELFLWDEIRRVAPELHEEWESPALWRRIENSLITRKPVQQSPAVWRWLAAAAAVTALALLVAEPWKRSAPSPEPLLSETVLAEVEHAEAAYARSIDKLAANAREALEKSPAPIAAVYREKLMVLDSAINDVKSNIEENRYNSYLRMQLAAFYKEKQNTLKEWIEYAQRN